MKDLIALFDEFNQYYQLLFQQYKEKFNLSLPTNDLIKKKSANQKQPQYCILIKKSVDNSFLILEKLKQEDPSEVHKHLSQLYYFEKIFNKFLQEKNQDKKSELKKLVKAQKKIKKFLSFYDYKLKANYQANNALLLAALIFDSTNQSIKENVKADVTVLKIKTPKEELTLKKLAEKFCSSTGKSDRNLQFLAIGITSKGDAWVTSNAHTPIVYPLEYFLTKEKYQEAEKKRSKYKVEHRQSEGAAAVFSYGENTIHAETMIASLKDALDIQYILLIDGNGKKVENCPFCSNCLSQKGFGCQPHMEQIQNYAVPTEEQINVSADFGLTLQSISNSTLYEWINIDLAKVVNANEAVQTCNALLAQAFKLLPFNRAMNKKAELAQIFDAIKENYPFELDNVSGLKNTYHLSRKLASPDSKSLPRTVVRKEASTRQHDNSKLQILDDNRLTIDVSGNKLTCVEPSSPRSSSLVKYANEWLKKGDPSVRKIQKNNTNIIELKR